MGKKVLFKKGTIVTVGLTGRRTYRVLRRELIDPPLNPIGNGTATEYIYVKPTDPPRIVGDAHEFKFPNTWLIEVKKDAVNKIK